MKPSDYLKKGWCRGSMARDKGGKAVSPNSDKAVAWCLWGSLYAEVYLQGSAIQEAMFQCPADMMEFNDAPGRTQHECVEVMMKAETEVGVS